MGKETYKAWREKRLERIEQIKTDINTLLCEKAQAYTLKDVYIGFSKRYARRDFQEYLQNDVSEFLINYVIGANGISEDISQFLDTVICFKVTMYGGVYYSGVNSINEFTRKYNGDIEQVLRACTARYR